MKIKDLMISKAFPVAPNTAVFTTHFVITQDRPITYVTHELEDGAWQFFSDDEFEKFEDVSMIVGLQEIIDKDSSLLQIADLAPGYMATRKSKSDSWMISQMHTST